jgi:hypothetical protein
VRAPQRLRPCEEVEDGLPYGGHARFVAAVPRFFFFRPAALRRRDWRKA